MSKKQFGIVGNTFTHLTGGNLGYSVHGKASKYIEWSNEDRDVTFYIDNSIPLAFSDTRERFRYAWLLEARHINGTIIEDMILNYEKYFKVFDKIFTHDKRLLNLDPRFKWVPAQGFWIKNPQIYDKTKLVSMISSDKRMFSGHIDRLIWVETLRDRVDLYGRGFKEIEYKEDGLCDYMFSVAIENGVYETYYTEKLLDCFATGTIPVYLGAPDIGEHFNKDGIISIYDFDTISSDMYYQKMDAIKENLELVKSMEILEDFIYERYLQKAEV